MSVEQNKTVYWRFIQELFNEGKVDQVGELVSPSFVFHDAPPGAPSGITAIPQVVTTMRAGFPDLKITIEEMIGEGDLITARTTIRGTHQGMAFGVPATGQKVKATGLAMVRIVDGRVVESWAKNDLALVVQRLAG